MARVSITSHLPGERVRGTGQTIGEDRHNHAPGEQAQLDIGFASDGRYGHYRIVRLVDGDPAGSVYDFGEVQRDGALRFQMPSESGRYAVTIDGEVVERFDVGNVQTPDRPETAPALDEEDALAGGGPAGDPVPDDPADPSSGSSSPPTSTSSGGDGGGMIGTTVAVIVVLAAGAVAVLGGN
ncbi:hypothetical protein [Haloplanus salinarum]|uniref:hypothetical protein n=1 Tax=Haloplanus salinarum TaxID=1912324 RepID=UPI00214B1DFC|nr:hypothetical protein [Haloplanus salinarum]